MLAHLPPDPGSDRITISIRRSDLVAAVGAAVVYAELTLVQHLAPATAAVVTALALALFLIRRS
ncbi:hypothetical protein CLM62_47050 [Streptomyces sp. SA15]|uniref:hypothetical protein n=1 Tax=Streptomyces sp. SA15 TaxID=934019 RepID=UPI000BB05714|nr:hypothetical protein [Streptomyces sp. SA15]PAZ09327.1 hypothetical protein CLM62_47050 [Streptomyces sp. SA15]